MLEKVLSLGWSYFKRYNSSGGGTMLVEIFRGLKLKGYSTVLKRKHWYSRGTKERCQISLRTGIHTICDEEEIELNVENLLKEEINNSGWGENFEGWSDYEWTRDLRIVYIKDLKMNEIIEKLTGEQFKNEFGITKPIK